MIPEFLKDSEATGETNTLGYGLLLAYKDKPPSYSTVLRWLHLMKFKYSTKAKSYMVDGHEHPAQRKHRKWLTREYTMNLERRCHRWVQMTVQEFESLPKREEILKKGHSYRGINGEEMIEYHVDDHECLQEYACQKYGKFGGNVSVRMPSGKPLIIFGQDESVFNQFAFGAKQWVGSSGERALLPKSEGAGLMVSGIGIQSREFGFGVELSDDELQAVNEKRSRDGEYVDKVAAKEVTGKTKKEPLTESPFVRLLEYGANKDGYWTGNHMVVQLEDCIDVCKVLFDDYDHLFMVDHSSGHAMKREGGLDASKMTKGAGGTKQRATIIKKKEGYLGPFHDPTNCKMVKVGEKQHMNWDDINLSDDDGPWYMSVEERKRTRDGVIVHLPENKWITENKTIKSLINEIKAADDKHLIDGRKLTKMKLPELQTLAVKFGLATTKTITSKTERGTGWKGKGKGLAQILWERGWIDESKWSEYKVKCVDEEGKIVPHLSLQQLLASCDDFMNEKCQLEYIAEKLGATVLITTKYHAEYAGEGIEYSWGLAKAMYRKKPLESKKGKDNFHSLVHKCISRNLINVEMVRKFSKRAREYMLTYMYFEENNSDTNDGVPVNITCTKIEKMKKIMSSHRAALDFDHAFINGMIVSKGFDVDSCMKSEKSLAQDIRIAKRMKLER